MTAAPWGTTWWVEPSPSLSNNDMLNAVSCGSSTFCIAVGTTNQNNPLLESFDGNGWSVVSLAAVPGLESQLRGVSCVSASFCLAVGDTVTAFSPVTKTSPLVEKWNGTAWTRLSDVVAAQWVDVDSVSCPTTTRCFLIGNQWTIVNGMPAPAPWVERWNGTTFTVDAVANQPTRGFLNGVSCASASFCVAAGKYVTGAVFAPLAEHWNGATWTIVAAPYAERHVERVHERLVREHVGVLRGDPGRQRPGDRALGRCALDRDVGAVRLRTDRGPLVHERVGVLGDRQGHAATVE